MTLIEAEQALRQISYKPQYVLKWSEVAENVLEVWGEFVRPDAFNPEELGVGRSGTELMFLPRLHTREQLARKVFGMTLRLEEHEAREFFTVSDERPFDPHVRLLADEA